MEIFFKKKEDQNLQKINSNFFSEISLPTSEKLIKLLLVFCVFASIDFLDILTRSLNLINLQTPFHSNLGIVFLIPLSFIFLSWARIFIFNKNHVLIFMIPLIYGIQENIGYILFSNNYGQYYIEMFFWFGLIYYLVERILLNNKETLLPNLYFLYKCFIGMAVALNLFLLFCKFFLSEFNPFIDYTYITSTNKIAYYGLASIFLLLYYPFEFFNKNWKNNLLITFLIVNISFVGSLGNQLTLILILLIYLKRWQYSLLLTFILVFMTLAFVNGYSEFFQNLTYGIGVIDPKHPDEIINLNNQLTSTYIRNVTNALVIMDFLNNPFFGSGNYNIKENLRYAGHFSHTIFLILLASYGVLTFVFTSVVLYLSSGIENNFKKNGFFSLCVLFIMIGMFNPKLMFFFSILFILYKYFNVANREQNLRKR